MAGAEDGKGQGAPMAAVAGLLESVRAARWFSRLGRFEATPGFVRLGSLVAWAEPSERATDLELALAEAMEWLPTSPDEPDPLVATAPALDQAQRAAVLEVERTTLTAMRDAGHPLLAVGPHDFSRAAMAGGRYAIRRFARELCLAEPGPWTPIARLFLAGHWPCGRLPDGEIVVL